MSIGFFAGYGVQYLTSSLAFQQRSLALAARELATGKRNFASDPSGVLIGESLLRQARILNPSLDSLALASGRNEVSQAGLEAVRDLYEELQSVVEQATNGSLTTQERQDLQDQADLLKESLEGVLASTAFNTTKVFDGGPFSVFVSGQNIELNSLSGEEILGSRPPQPGIIEDAITGINGTGSFQFRVGGGQTGGGPVGIETFNFGPGTTAQDVVDAINAESGNIYATAELGSDNQSITLRGTFTGTNSGIYFDGQSTSGPTFKPDTLDFGENEVDGLVLDLSSKVQAEITLSQIEAGLEEIDSQASGLATNQTIIESNIASIEAQQASFEAAGREYTDVDPIEAAIKFEEQALQLETSFQLFDNYLRFLERTLDLLPGLNGKDDDETQPVLGSLFASL